MCVYTLWCILLVIVWSYTTANAWETDCGWSTYSDAGCDQVNGQCAQPGSTVDVFILSGWQAREDEFPYQVALLDSSTGSLLCGGSIINTTHVITAAHCVNNKLPSDIKVRVGSTDLSSPGANTVQVTVTRITIHPGYGPLTLQNDIALVKLSTSLTYNNAVQPICPPEDRTFDDLNCVVSGWGSSTTGGATSNGLLYAGVVVLAYPDCSICQLSVQPTNICTGLCDSGASTTCQGDSGGPLVYKKSDGRFELVGITSFGSGCTNKGGPEVYTRVSSYLNWIETGR